MIDGIPRIIHQIWIQGVPPRRYDNMRHSYQRQQQFGWEYRLWSSLELTEFIETQYPKYATLWQELDSIGKKADLARYLLVHHFGGVYADIDTQLIYDLEDLLQNELLKQCIAKRFRRASPAFAHSKQGYDIILSREFIPCEYLFHNHAALLDKINNGLLFSKASLSFWTDYVEFALEGRDLSVLDSFGVHSFSEFVYRHLLDDWNAARLSRGRKCPPPRILLLPPTFFCPPGKLKNLPLIVHYYHGNWRKDPCFSRS